MHLERKGIDYNNLGGFVARRALHLLWLDPKKWRKIIWLCLGLTLLTWVTKKNDYNETVVMYAPSQAWLGVREGMKGGIMEKK